MKDNLKPRGRRARAEASSRVGQSWDTEISPVFIGPDKQEYNAQQFYGKFGNSKLAKCEPIKTVFTRRWHCGKLLEQDCRGFAFCPKCGMIFNSGNPEDGDCPKYETKAGYLGPPCPA